MTGAVEADIFFGFTAVPGERYLLLRLNTPASFELVQNGRRSTFRNIR